MAIVEGNQQTQNPGSARFPGPGKMIVQRKRFKLAVYDGADPVYNGAFDVHMDEMSVVETASVSIEHALSAVAAENYRAVVEKIQKNVANNEDKNCVVVGVQEVLDGGEIAGTLDGFYFVVEAEGY